jgi:hypothetical protein
LRKLVVSRLWTFLESSSSCTLGFSYFHFFNPKKTKYHSYMRIWVKKNNPQSILWFRIKIFLMFKPKVGILLIVKLKVRRFLIFWLKFKIFLCLNINLFGPKG